MTCDNCEIRWRKIITPSGTHAVGINAAGTVASAQFGVLLLQGVAESDIPLICDEQGWELIP